MTIKVSTPGADNSLGLIKDIRAEFGGTPGLAPDGRINPARISQYYRGGEYVSDSPTNQAIPTAGLVRFSNYYGAKSGPAPVITFPNSGFENGTTGWTLINEQIWLNGRTPANTSGRTTILGWPTPTDPTANPQNNVGQVSPGAVSYFPSGSSMGLVSSPFGTGNALRLTINNGRVTPRAPSGALGNGTLLYGPVIVSENAGLVVAGTQLVFNWYAQPGGDAYNVFGYMLNPDNGNTIVILDDMNPNNGGLQTTSITFTGAQAGTYHFVFVCGAFDYTFGRVIGATLIIDNINLIQP
jgi:hypothetical protein